MIEGLKPYPDYRKTAESWLSAVPAHWEFKRCRYLFREVDRRSEDGQETHLSMSQKLGLVPASQVTRSLVSASYAGGKLCSTGDLVLNRLKAHLGVFSYAQQAGVISPDYTVLRLKRGGNVRYLEAVLRSPQCRWELRTRTKGIVEGFWRLYTDDLYGIRVPLPPPDEQAAIVKFLDHADRRIRRYIRAKQKLIKLLEEQKQAIIHQAVTRGLNPNVKLKPSGVPWLGDVPEHWEVLPIKRLLARMDYGTSESLSGEGKVRVLTMGHIRDGQIRVPERGALHAISNHLVLEHNDLLFNRTNSPDLVGKVGLFAGDVSDQITFASYLVRLRAKPPHDPEWLNHLLNSKTFWAFARSQALVSLHQANLNSTRYGGLQVPVPPEHEQSEIVRLVASRIASLTLVQSRARSEVGLLQEYRTRLISDVITGKLDVRQAAASLPDEISEEEPLEEVEEELDEDAEEASDEGDE